MGRNWLYAGGKLDTPITATHTALLNRIQARKDAAREASRPPPKTLLQEAEDQIKTWDEAESKTEGDYRQRMLTLELTAEAVTDHQKLIKRAERLTDSPWRRPPAEQPKKDDPPPRFRTFVIPRGVRYKGLGSGGDVLVCKRRYNADSQLPCNTPRLKREGRLGKWYVFVYKNGGPAINRLERVGRRRVYGDMWIKSEGVCTYGSMNRNYGQAVYEVIEVQPSSDRNWRRDREFVAAVERLGMMDQAGTGGVA